MANYMNISGTTKGTFAIGATGPIIERDGSAFKFKTNKAATTLTDITVAKLTSDSVSTSAITTSGKILPSKTESIDIGSATLKFANVYAKNFQGTLKGNADTATTADAAKGFTSDGAIANEFGKVLYLSGGTMTGILNAPYIKTGTASDAYFQSQKFRGEGTAASYQHAIDFGYANHNKVDFYEYGGLWNFWKNTTAAATTDAANLALSIQIGQLVERSYTLKFPGKSGTFALTDDVSAVQTGIEDGTIVALKASQDADGNSISGTYHKTADFNTFKSSLGSLAYQSKLTAAQVNAVGDITNNTSGKAGSAEYAAYLGDSSKNYSYSTLSTALGNKISASDATVEATADKIVKRSSTGGIKAKSGDFDGEVVIQKSGSSTEASNSLTIYQGSSSSANKASIGIGATGHLVESLTTGKSASPRIAFEITATAQSGSPTATAYVENSSGKSLFHADKIDAASYTVGGTDLYSTNSSGYVSQIAGKGIATTYDKNGKDISSEYVHKSGTWTSGKVLVSNGTNSAAVSTIEVSGNDVTIKGNLHLGGTTDQVDVENLSITDKVITLNGGATAALSANDGSGLLISKYDGTNYGALAFDKNGDILAGTLAPAKDATAVTSIDTSKLRKLMMRPSSDIADGTILAWDNTNKTVAATGMTRSGTTVTITDAIKMTNSISPTANNKYDLGTSTNAFKTVYATSFNGKATDSDKLDGQDASYFATASDMTTAQGNISTLKGYFTDGKANNALKADSAATATNLAAAPSLPISGNTVAVKVGDKTSSYITIPYATSAGSATSANTATNYASSGGIATALNSKISTSGGTISSGKLTISSASGLDYTGIGSGTANANRVVWFADNTSKGMPVYNDNFQYNPATNVLTVGSITGSAASATNVATLSNNDEAENNHIKFTIGDKSFEKTVNNVANATTAEYFLKTTSATDSSGNVTTTTSKSANTIQNEFGSVLYKSGGTMTGNIYFNDHTPSAITGTNPRGVYGSNGANDGWRIAGVGTASNSAALEIATCDDGDEPIYVRQYNGGGSSFGFANALRTATLLDGSGNTSFPGTVSATKFSGSLTGNADTATTATNLAEAPSLAASSNAITVTVGGQTSAAFTVPYATKAAQDGDGNTITTKYVTKDTAQTISGSKTFTGGLASTAFKQSDASKGYVDLITGDGVDFGIKGGNGQVYDLSTFANATNYVKKSGDTLSGALTFTTTDALKYTGSKATYSMIRFIDNASDEYGNGISIGGGGAVVIGSGESASTLQTAESIIGNTENTYIAADGSIWFYTSCDTIANRKSSYISGGVYYGNVTGNLTGNASSADKFSSAATVKLTGDVTGEASSTKGWSVATTIGDGKITASKLGNVITTGSATSDGLTVTLSQTSSKGGLSIGLSGTATDATNATYATILKGSDTRSVNSLPGEYFKSGVNSWVKSEFKSSGTVGSSECTYSQLLTFTPWTDSSGGYPVQMLLSNGKNIMKLRYGSATEDNSSTQWGSWQNVITSSTLNDYTIANATKAAQDGSGNNIVSTYATKAELKNKADSGHNHDGTYLKLSGGTLTGALTMLNDQYYTNGVYGVNMRNSDMINLNSIYTGDLADNTSEGIRFYRTSTTYDTLTASGGTLYFMPNDPKAGSALTSAYKVITSNNVTTHAKADLKADLLSYY